MLSVDPATEQLVNLLDASARGDQSAFAQLYELTSPRLYGVALRMIRRRDGAEEVLQDAFVSIWQHAADYRAAKSAPMTWMTAIVRNRCLDWLRRPRSEEGGDDASLASVVDESGGPLDRLMQSAAMKSIFSCLKVLNAAERQSIALAFFHGLTHAELAQHLRQPLGTVKSCVRRGLARLKECLEA
jgi:RNA polymerase sigma-70 factor (ECF subfamily)